MRIAFIGAILFLTCSSALAQEAACALGYVYDEDTRLRIPNVTVHIVDGQEAMTNAEGYYAIPIPPNQPTFSVYAVHQLYNPRHLHDTARAAGQHTTNCDPLPLRQSARLSHPQARAALRAAEQELMASRSPEMRSAIRESIRTMQAVLAATRYVDETYAMNVPVRSIELRRGCRPTQLGCRPFIYRALVDRCEQRPITVRVPFDVDTPQEAQANAEEIRVANYFLQRADAQQIAMPSPNRDRR